MLIWERERVSKLTCKLKIVNVELSNIYGGYEYMMSACMNMRTISYLNED